VKFQSQTTLIILAAVLLPCLIFAQSKPLTGGDNPGDNEKAHEAGEASWADLRIVVTGDVNLNRNRVEVLPNASNVWGTMVPFEDFLKGVPGVFDGDINFGNIETVVTDTNDIPEKDKAFCFRTHPNGIRTLLKNGYNLLSLANNHAYDYGAQGVRETIKNLRALEKEYSFYWAGVGNNKDEAIRPAVFEVKGIKVGFVALGIGHAATRQSPGVGQEIYYREALQRLKDTGADLLILSCHDGKEGTSHPIDRQMRVYREAIGVYGVDIVIGHHPHVVQGIEHYKDGLIFYSLGNFMIRGAADMGKRPGNKNIKDFGLLGRIDMRIQKGGVHRFKRLEIVPMYDMHQGVHPFSDVNQAYIRIDTVNHLSSLESLNRNYHSKLPRPTRSKSLVFKKVNGTGIIDFPYLAIKPSE